MAQQLRGQREIAGGQRQAHRPIEVLKRAYFNSGLQHTDACLVG